MPDTEEKEGARPSDQALVASPSNPQAVSTKGFDPSRVRAIAGGLTDAQARALLALDDGRKGGRSATSANHLKRMGLLHSGVVWTDRSRVDGYFVGYWRTALGAAVARAMDV